MAGPKDGESFLRKVVRFVANPSTDWTDLNSRQAEPDDNELERSELKAMIERKRRNDFVRRREFDMLRRVRREGLTPEQLAALGSSSRIDDSGVRAADGARPGVKAKIDAIEQQMVGETVAGGMPTRRHGGIFNVPTAPAGLSPDDAAGADDSLGLSSQPPSSVSPRSVSPRTMPPRSLPPLDLGDADDLPALPPLSDTDDDLPLAGPASTPAVMASGLPPLTPTPPPLVAGGRPPTAAPSPDGSSVEVSEAVHDPDLDEAVIAFANADFDHCEHLLTRLTRAFGPRAQHADTWLVLFDLYRATGRQQPFESLAMEYVHQFGWSAPQWYSLPQLVADAKRDEPVRAPAPGDARTTDVGWTAPEQLDVEALSRLRSQTLQMPLPWVFDWSALRGVDAEAATQLSVLCRMWAGQALEMHWIGGDRLFAALQEAAPTGVRDADPAFWLARLDALRLTNRADQFDEVAIDYCVTYEVSPPSWEPARCTVRIGNRAGASTRPPPLSLFSDVSTTFQESGLLEAASVEVASVELSGQLVGDISETLGRLGGQLGSAPMVSVSCARLIRVDFLAAGDLLNWVLTLHGQDRTVQFTDAHRLVALFFSAMGINEHAQVQVRRV
jgi:hypothetical protein